MGNVEYLILFDQATDFFKSQDVIMGIEKLK